MEFQLQHQSFQWTPRTDLFRMNWLDLLSVQFIQFSGSVNSDSLRPHELQHTRPPCPSRIPRAYPNSLVIAAAAANPSVVSESVRPHRQQPTKLPRPWDSPGKNTGVGCHFLLQCMKVKSESEVAQSCLTLSEPMDCSVPGSSVHGIFQAVGCHCLLHVSH